MREHFYTMREVKQLLKLTNTQIETLVQLNRIVKIKLTDHLHGYSKSDVDQFKLEHPHFHVYPQSHNFIKLLMEYEQNRLVIGYGKKIMVDLYKKQSLS